jgi:hypothetical protein
LPSHGEIHWLSSGGNNAANNGSSDGCGSGQLSLKCHCKLKGEGIEHTCGNTKNNYLLIHLEKKELAGMISLHVLGKAYQEMMIQG